MTAIAVNGSPRKRWNTALLLQQAIDGAREGGAETELIHLHDLAYQGCRSCFACKYRDGKSYGRCAVSDGLTPVLLKIEEQADALILGTPIYFGSMTGAMRSFLERLLFAPIVYSVPARSLFPRKLHVLMIYTMNATEEMSKQRNYGVLLESTETYLRTIFGRAETYCCYDTCQFPDYGRVEMELFDPQKKAARRQQAFPQDCRNVRELGYRLARDHGAT